MELNFEKVKERFVCKMERSKKLGKMSLNEKIRDKVTGFLGGVDGVPEDVFVSISASEWAVRVA